MLGAFDLRLLRAGSGAADLRRAARSRRAGRHCGIVRGMTLLSAGSSRAHCIFGAAFVLAALGGAHRVRPLLPRGAAAVLRVRRGAFPVRLGRHRGATGRAVLDLAGAAAHLPRATSRSRAATPSSACWPATAHEMPIGLSKVTVGFPRVGINCAMCHTASCGCGPDDAPTIVPAAPSHQTAPQAVPALPVCVRVRSALHRRHHPRRDREELPAVAAWIGCCYRFAIIPRTRRGLLELRDGRTPGCATGPTGAAAASIPSTR